MKAVVMFAPLAHLYLSPFNVRQSTGEERSDGELRASLAAHGVIEPLVVHPWEEKAGYGVLAGGRRLRALQANHAGENPNEVQVPIILREGTDAELREISFAENAERVDLRPHEEYAAFVSFGGTPEEIAARFGKPVRYVNQRLRLGNLYGPIFQALATGAIDVETAEAYAATDDHAVQQRVFDANEAAGYHHVHSIRREIKGASAAHDVQQKLMFVGRNAYLEAGGTVTEDLFEDDADIINDIDLLNRLFDEALPKRIEVLTDRLAKRFGVPIQPVTDYRQTGAVIQPIRGELGEEDQAELERLYDRTREIEARLFTDDIEIDEGEGDALESERADISVKVIELDEKRPLSLPEGVTRLVYVPQIRAGMVTASQFFLPAEATEEELQQVDEPLPQVPAVQPAEPKSQLTKRAVEEIAAARRQILVNFFDDNDPAIHGFATHLLLFTLARARYGYDNTLGFSHIGPGAGPRPAFTELPWFKEPCEEVAFAMFCAGDDAEIEHVAQQLLGRMIEPKIETPIGILSGLGQWQLPSDKIRSRRYWEPTAAFFDLFNKGQLAAMVEPVDPDQASTMRRMKTGDAKARALAFFLGEVTGTAPETRAKALAWVPEWLVFHVEQSPVQSTEHAEHKAPDGVRDVGRINEAANDEEDARVPEAAE